MRVLSTPLLVLLVAANVLAATYHLEPDGTGDFPTIQAALDASVDHDIVELADGTYTGAGNRNLVMDFSFVTLRSVSDDPNACIIDCDGSVFAANRGLTLRDGANPAGGPVLRGFTVTRAYGSTHGAALLIESDPFGGSAVEVVNCVFKGNGGAPDVAAVHIDVGYRPVRFTDCGIRENDFGGLLTVNYDTLTLLRCDLAFNDGRGFSKESLHETYLMTVTDSDFRGNGGDGFFTDYGGDVLIEQCAFTGNGGHGLYCHSAPNSTVEVLGCLSAYNDGKGVAVHRARLARLETSTIARNGAQGVWIFDQYSTDDCEIDNTIIVENDSLAVETVNSAGGVLASCTDISGNVLGDWVGAMAGQNGLDGNISADPLFCDPDDGDFTLSEHSPCAPAQSGCGTMGAFGIFCSITSVEDPGFTIPSAFRVGPAVPNPFNPATAIAYEIPTAARVTVTIHDARGRRVRTLHDAEQGPGAHRVVWDGTGDDGGSLASGAYMCRIAWGGESASRRLLLLK